MIKKEFLSIKELAVIFSVDESTIRRAVKRGWIIAIRIGDGPRSPYRISMRTLDDIHETMVLLHRNKTKK